MPVPETVPEGVDDDWQWTYVEGAEERAGEEGDADARKKAKKATKRRKKLEELEEQERKRIATEDKGDTTSSSEASSIDQEEVDKHVAEIRERLMKESKKNKDKKKKEKKKKDKEKKGKEQNKGEEIDPLPDGPKRKRNKDSSSSSDDNDETPAKKTKGGVTFTAEQLQACTTATALAVASAGLQTNSSTKPPNGEGTKSLRAIKLARAGEFISLSSLLLKNEGGKKRNKTMVWEDGGLQVEEEDETEQGFPSNVAKFGVTSRRLVAMIAKHYDQDLSVRVDEYMTVLTDLIAANRITLGQACKLQWEERQGMDKSTRFPNRRELARGLGFPNVVQERPRSPRARERARSPQRAREPAVHERTPPRSERARHRGDNGNRNGDGQPPDRRTKGFCFAYAKGSQCRFESQSGGCRFVHRCPVCDEVHIARRCQRPSEREAWCEDNQQRSMRR
jgi:hypothetical protein